MGKHSFLRSAFILSTALTVAGCQEGTQPFAFLSPKPAAAGDAGAVTPATSTRLVERDVEAPSAFSADEAGLWDGRPSLGGVWVADPSVKDPERVIIRNTANGKFVIGALFRRERDNPGPKLQVSSDAAAALGMLAGAPTRLSVVALRREEAGGSAPATTALATPAADAVSTQALAAAPAAPAGKVRPTTDTIKAAGAAIAASQTGKTPAQPAPAPAGTSYVQLGIFSVEQNAKRAAAQVAKSGVKTEVRTEESQGKTFWRVVAGPAAADALMKKLKALGYTDAYVVSR